MPCADDSCDTDRSAVTMNRVDASMPKSWQYFQGLGK